MGLKNLLIGGMVNWWSGKTLRVVENPRSGWAAWLIDEGTKERWNERTKER